MATLFSRETTDFLFENCLHNDKDFQAALTAYEGQNIFTLEGEM